MGKINYGTILDEALGRFSKHWNQKGIKFVLRTCVDNFTGDFCIKGGVKTQKKYTSNISFMRTKNDGDPIKTTVEEIMDAGIRSIYQKVIKEKRETSIRSSDYATYPLTLEDVLESLIQEKREKIKGPSVWLEKADCEIVVHRSKKLLDKPKTINLTRKDLQKHNETKPTSEITLYDFRASSMTKKEMEEASLITFSDGDETVTLKNTNPRHHGKD